MGRPRAHDPQPGVSWTPVRTRGEAGAAPVDGPYVLAVAAQYPHKNLETLVRAFAADARARRPPRHAARARRPARGRNLSGVAWTRPLDDVIDDVGVRDAVHVTGYLDDARSATRIATRPCSRSPRGSRGSRSRSSRRWGSACRSSPPRSTAIPEVTRGLATYLDDPLDAAAMADRLEAMLDDPSAFRPAADDGDPTPCEPTLRRRSRLRYRGALARKRRHDPSRSSCSRSPARVPRSCSGCSPHTPRSPRPRSPGSCSPTGTRCASTGWRPSTRSRSPRARSASSSPGLPDGEDDYWSALRGFALELYAKAAEPDATHFLDKTPRYHYIAPELFRLFPDAKVVFLWRNPLAVVASIVETWTQGQVERGPVAGRPPRGGVAGGGLAGARRERPSR